MSNANVNELSNLLSLVMGASGFASGLILWYKGSVEKRYAAERDFNHLRKNQEQISTALNLLMEEVECVRGDTSFIRDTLKDVDHNLDDLNRTETEQKAFVIAISNRIEGISARLLDGFSSGWSRSNSTRPE